MKKRKNPFKLMGYHGPELFCDREIEVTRLITNIENEVNTTLFSLRRMGKTGLIRHTFYQLEQQNKIKTIYVDIFDTKDFRDFTNRMATAILNTFPEKQSIGEKFIQILKGFNPTISYDQFTGIPEVSLNYHSEQQAYTIQGLFQFLEQQSISVVVAIDEFQQIAYYPEKNIEATLRTIIQQLKNIHFIFSGSQKHILLEMFNSAKRPFFSTTPPMSLDKIDHQKYHDFIKHLFEVNEKFIDDESIEFILFWTKRHTYYTQALSHKIYEISGQKIDLDMVYKACDQLLQEQEVVFYQYRNLLTTGQWNLLCAIAKEDVESQPTGAQFVSKHSLGNPASVKRGIDALIEKEMIVKEMDAEGKYYYEVYNVFLSRWLSRKYKSK